MFPSTISGESTMRSHLIERVQPAGEAKEEHMSYLLGGGQVVLGVGLFIAWYLALVFMSARLKNKPMTSMGFAVTPSLFLLWGILAGVLIVRGVGGI
jgi:hypothetical protein